MQQDLTLQNPFYVKVGVHMGLSTQEPNQAGLVGLVGSRSKQDKVSAYSYFRNLNGPVWGLG